MIRTTVIYTTFAKAARKKVRSWHKDKSNLKILTCIPVQDNDKGYKITFSYDEK